MKTDWFINRSKSLGMAAVLLMLSVGANAQESVVKVPWENIVKADDTAVFWVLASFAVLQLILIWVVAGVTKGLLSDTALWKGKWGSSAKAIAAIFGTSLFLSSTQAFAQTEAVAAPLFEMSDGLFWIMVIVNAFLLLVLLGMLYNLSSLIKSLRSKEETLEVEAERSVWEGALSAAVPLEHEKDILMDHEYDGIMELDNKLPPWWLYMFYFTIIFGVVYIIYYQFSDGPGQYDEYNTEMAIAAEEKEAMLANSANNVDENTATLLTDATSISNGKAKFESLCIACHGMSGGSTQEPLGVGPNLTDEYWIHGGGVKNIFKIIKYGNPSKGMISWEAQLTPVQIQEVASYIISLQGSNPENAREPQGEIWTEGDEVSVGAESTEEGTAVVEEEAEIEMLTDAKSLANGKSIFDAMCVACHGLSGGSMPGGVGPNLTDEYWIYGGGTANVVKVINEGVLAKGMIPFKNTLSEQQVMEVASYVMSLQGTEPENAKEPQGEPWSDD
jgi:cytochrome c oxidase cbb3-type subunit 3